jgi:hypothetical protein
VSLLVIGGPTHAFSTSTADSRASAARQGVPLISRRRGVREWMSAVELDGSPLAAAFDTRLHRPRWFWGSAARRIHRQLPRIGARLAVEPECFYVRFPSKKVPVELSLVDGELERAEAWGVELSHVAPTAVRMAPAAAA